MHRTIHHPSTVLTFFPPSDSAMKFVHPGTMNSHADLGVRASVEGDAPFRFAK